MKFLTSKTAELITDILLSVLLGAAACAMWLPFAGITVGFGDCLLVVLADCLLLVLFTRKWWVFPAIAAAAAVITVVTMALMGTLDSLLPYIGGFFEWCAELFPAMEPYSFNNSIVAATLCLGMPMAALALLFFRRLFLFPVLPPIALGLLLWCHFSENIEFWPVLIMLLLCVFLSMAKMTGRRINKTLPHNKRIPGVLLVLTAAVVAPLIVLVAFGIGPAKDGDWRSKGLVNAVEDIGDFLSGGGGSPAQGSFDIAISGFSPLQNRLGGDVVLDHTPVMHVNTDMPVLLKGAVYNTYDGHRWYDSTAIRRFRFIGLLSQGVRQQIFELNKPEGGQEAKSLYADITRSVAMDISYSKSGRTLFTSGQVQSIEKSADTADLFFNTQAELFISENARSLKYTLQTVVFHRGLPDFDQRMLALEALMLQTQDSRLAAIQSEYLQLPETLPDDVCTTAQTITKDCSTPYQKARAIEDWLSKNSAYTLTPGTPPENEDFVSTFLSRREGYCVYYASAMTVLARCAGLPARYATGYALKRNPRASADNAYIATNATAHAWAEVYFQGIGWVPFDATGWNASEDAIVEQRQQQAVNPYMMPTPTPALETLLSPDDKNIPAHGIPTEVKALLYVLGGIAAAAALLALCRFWRLQEGEAGFYRRLCRKYSTESDRLEACYRTLLKQLTFLNVRPQTDDTITRFAQRADNQLHSTEISAACTAVLRLRYGFIAPSEDDVRLMCATIVRLEKKLRTDMGLSAYLWRRLLRGR